jgi:hypothetical protein
MIHPRFLVPALGLGLGAFACTKGTESAKTDDTTVVSDGCAFDTDDENFENATPLSIGAAAEAELCPEGDQDWYAVTQPSGDDLLTVEIGIDAPLSALDLAYNIYLSDGATVVGGPNSGETAVAGTPLTITHGLVAGDYLVRVRDVGDDGEDQNHPYTVMVTAGQDPDPNEPNNSAQEATAGTAGIQGYIAYREDQDWYSFTAPARGLAHVTLEMPVGAIAPAFRIVDRDGAELILQSNEAGTRKETVLDYWQAIDKAGTYYVVVEDDDLTQFDGTVPYTIDISVQDDPDENEPNDDPLTVTELGAMPCNDGFSTTFSREGFLAASGDNDWYALDVSSCATGVIEFSAIFDSPNALPDEMTTTIRLVREVGDQTCATNDECQQLAAYPCTQDTDCQFVGNECGTAGFCTGTGYCLDGGHCAATVIADTALDTSPGTITVAAPIRGWTRLMVAVADAGSDANSVTQPYQVSVKVADDPDTHEPNEMYYAKVAKDEWADYHDDYATPIPIYDCTNPKSGSYACCSSSPWTDGTIAYKFDQDWFRYDHPCPGEDCMVRVHYQIDSGPIDHWVRMYTGTSPWFDIEFMEDTGNQSAVSGTYGGLAGGDECLYAYSGHSSPYNIRVRDNAIAGDGNDGLWDFSSTQNYSVCVEKIAAGCQSPCVDDPKYGCSVP